MATTSWMDMATFGIAVPGAALGVMNTWDAISKQRVRLPFIEGMRALEECTRNGVDE